MCIEKGYIRTIIIYKKIKKLVKVFFYKTTKKLASFCDFLFDITIKKKDINQGNDGVS